MRRPGAERRADVPDRSIHRHNGDGHALDGRSMGQGAHAPIHRAARRV